MSLKIKIPSSVKGRKYKYNYPNTSPVIYSLSPSESLLTNYTVCYVNGLNFSKSNTTGNSTITFGDIKNIPVTFYSSLNISFVIPNNLVAGTYKVQVVNNNFFPSTLYSNIVEYNCVSYPIIYSLSHSISLLGVKSICYINGLNFIKSNTTDNSTVTFGDITNIPVIFYNPSYISFEVPINITTTGTYNVQVFNNTNSYSNTVNYILT
jgi:hypothetical protein